MHQGRVLAGGSELAMDDIGNDEESSLKCITDEVIESSCATSIIELQTEMLTKFLFTWTYYESYSNLF